MTLDLGEQIKTYRAKYSRGLKTALVLLGFLCLSGGLVVFGWGVQQAYVFYFQHGPALLFNLLAIPVILGVALFCIAGVFFLLSRFRQFHVTLFENGISEKSNHQEQRWRWQELASIRSGAESQYFLGIKTSTKRTTTLTWKDGSRLVLDGKITQGDQLTDSIREKALPFLYENYAPAFAAGQALIFGGLRIQKGVGISIEKKTLAWDQIQQASVQKGMFRLVGKDSTGRKVNQSIPIGEVPNPEVLLALIKDCAGS